MNTSKKILLGLFLICLMFGFSKEVYANCNAITNKDACNNVTECNWVNGTCTVDCSKIQPDKGSGYVIIESVEVKKKCESYRQCRYMNGACYSNYVADAPCDNNNIRTVLKIFGYVLTIVKVAVPFIIIGIGAFDMYKSVIDKDDKSFQKQLKRLIMRIVIGLAIFFIPTVINALFKISDKLNIVSTQDYQTCASCVLEPFNDDRCSTKDIYE